MIPIPPTKDRPLSYYLSPQRVGTKLKSTAEKKQSEEQVVKQCTAWLKTQGWISMTLYTGGIPTASGRYATNPAKGIPDTINFHLATNRTVWIEYKKTHGGLVSPEQEMWHKLISQCGGVVLIVNSLDSLKSQINLYFSNAS